MTAAKRTEPTGPSNIVRSLIAVITAWLLATAIAVAIVAAETAAWTVFESPIETTKAYVRPFVDVEVDAIFEKADARWRVPTFWAGGGTGKVRFALLELGEYRYGSAGIWQSCVEGDFCITPIYDWSGFRALTTVTGEANCSTPSVPSPQDWVLVLLRR